MTGRGRPARRLTRPPVAAPRVVRRPRDLLVHEDAAPREVLDTVTGPFERRVGVLREVGRRTRERG